MEKPLNWAMFRTIVIAGLGGAIIGGAAIATVQHLRGAASPPGAHAQNLFRATADSTGIPGLTAADPAKIEIASDPVPQVRLSGVPADVPAIGSPGIYVRLPDEFERAASGQTVRVTITAKRVADAPNQSFAVAYSTSDVGNSGWRRFVLTDRLERHSFVYDVPEMKEGHSDFIGILPDPEGAGGAVQIADIAAEVFPRGSPLPPPPSALPEPAAVPEPAPAVAAPAATTPPSTASSADEKNAPLVVASRPGHKIVASAYYDLDVEEVRIPEIGRRGGVALLGPGLFIVTHGGGTYYLPDLNDPRRESIVALKEKLPFDLSSPKLQRFEEKTRSTLGAGAEPSRLGKSGAWDIYASMFEFDDAQDCISIVLYRATVTLSGGMEPEFDSPWERIYRSNPCRPLSDLSNEASLFEAGGRIAFDEDGILLTLGLGSSVRDIPGQSFDPSTQAYTQRDSHDYGKVLRIDRTTLAVTHIAKGFRNPQGLFVDDDGTIFMTEQGPQGGDELNILVPGGNYGWPVMTFGTQYGEKAWIYKQPDDTRKYIDPVFSFVPSVALTELVRIRGDAFPRWKGDFIATSLVGGSSGSPHGLSLFRLHYSGGRVLYSEPIFLDVRMRDIVETADGRLVVLTDKDRLLIISRADTQAPADGQQGAAAPAPAAEQPAVQVASASDASSGPQIFEEKCSSCHGLKPGNPNAIAPALGCVAGRPVASTDTFSYSTALKARSGEVWSEQSLAAFLRNPAAFAPGTKMEAPKVSEGEITAVVAFLAQSQPECGPAP